MDVSSGDASPPPIKWYARSALNDFLAGAAAERSRLELTLADANTRLASANAAIGLHQTMLDLLLDAQRDILGLRRAAEAEAMEIMVRGDAEAELILREAG